MAAVEYTALVGEVVAGTSQVAADTCLVAAGTGLDVVDHTLAEIGIQLQLADQTSEDLDLLQFVDA